LRIVFAGLILLAVFCVYANSLQNDFVWDDKALIVDNSSIRSWKSLRENFSTHLYHGTRNASNFYRPILEASFMVDYAVWKLRVSGWHFTNTLLHAINALLIFFIFGKIQRDYIASLVAAMLFAVHPIFTSAVTYISGRGDPLALFFILISFLFFVKSRYVLGFLFFLLAILTKETAIVLPILFFAYIKVIDRDRKPYVLLPYVGLYAVYGVLRATALNFPYVPTLTGGSTLYLRLLTMSKIIFMYLRLLILPLGLHMERNIPYVKSILEWQVLASVVALIGAGIFVGKKIYGREKYIFFGIMWFLIALLPVSNIKPLNMAMAEHWMYVPAIGLFSCAGLFFSKAIKKGRIWRYAGGAGLIAIVLSYSFLTFSQNKLWKDEKTFYTNFLQYVPDSFVVLTNMGNIYADEGNLNQAIRKYKKALEICPHFTAAHNSLARAYVKLGKLDKAVWHGERAVQYFPTLAEPHYKLAILYEHNESCVRYGAGFERDKAIAEYKKAIEIEPGYFWPHYNLAVVYEFNENGARYTDPASLKLAKKEYEKALKIDPSNTTARRNLQILRRKLRILETPK
jgi:tetratricopeptide (TPR) repeat protein